MVLPHYVYSTCVVAHNRHHAHQPIARTKRRARMTIDAQESGSTPMGRTDIAVVGLGKMGLSHLSMIKTHPDVRLVGVCDATKYMLDVLHKYTGVPHFTDFNTLLDQAKPAAVIIATPTHLHARMVRQAAGAGDPRVLREAAVHRPSRERRAHRPGRRTQRW